MELTPYAGLESDFNGGRSGCKSSLWYSVCGRTLCVGVGDVRGSYQGNLCGRWPCNAGRSLCYYSVCGRTLCVGMCRDRGSYQGVNMVVIRGLTWGSM